jgi:hypothetical protein
LRLTTDCGNGGAALVMLGWVPSPEAWLGIRHGWTATSSTATVRPIESLRTLGGTLDGEREARGGMHGGGQLSGGPPTPGPAFGVSTEIASVSVRGMSGVQEARAVRVASVPGPGGNLGSGIAGQGESIFRRPRPC